MVIGVWHPTAKDFNIAAGVVGLAAAALWFYASTLRRAPRAPREVERDGWVGASIVGEDERGRLTDLIATAMAANRWNAAAAAVTGLAVLLQATASLRRRMVEQAAATLRREGLWDRQRRLVAPADVTRIAVVHPTGAAGWADVAARLARWQAAGLLLVRSYPAPFEGQWATSALVRAIAAAAAADDDGLAPDLVLVVRGGGAREGLAALDDEATARAICCCPVPVIVGTGHATDTTLVDGCAWRRADTPTAAAALVTGRIGAAVRAALSNHAAIRAAASEVRRSRPPRRSPKHMPTHCHSISPRASRWLSASPSRRRRPPRCVAPRRRPTRSLLKSGRMSRSR